MTILGAEYVETRIIAVLQANLPAELALIATENGSDLTADTIPNAQYYSFGLAETSIPAGPAIAVDVTSSTPLGIKSTTNSPGVMHEEHEVSIFVHVKDNGNEGIAILKKRMQRIVLGVRRVLLIKYPSLPSGGAETVVYTSGGSVSYSGSGEAAGQYVRTGTIPVIVQTYENL